MISCFLGLQETMLELKKFNRQRSRKNHQHNKSNQHQNSQEWSIFNQINAIRRCKTKILQNSFNRNPKNKLVHYVYGKLYGRMSKTKVLKALMMIQYSVGLETKVPYFRQQYGWGERCRHKFKCFKMCKVRRLLIQLV